MGRTVALVTRAQIAMKDLVQHLNTSVRECPKPNVIRLHGLYHLNIVKIEKRKVCELEQRSQPRQVKKYVYTKQRRPVPKTVCDNADQMSLVPSCVPASRKECSFHPEER